MSRKPYGMLGLAFAAIVVSCAASPDGGEGGVGTEQAPLTSSQEQKLLASDPGAGDRLGSTVVISGNNLFLGAPFDDIGAAQDRGSLYVYARSGLTHTQTQQLSPGELGSFDHFGVSVAVSGDTMMAGADQANSGTVPDQGAVWVYTRNPQGLFVQGQKLVASDGAMGRRFGATVALAGNTAAIGANDALYVFERNGAAWVQTQKLDRPGQGLAPSLAMSSDTIVAGVPCDTLFGGCRGAVAVYGRAGCAWAQQQLLFATDGLANHRFGGAVSLAGDSVLIGAPGHGQNRGAAYVFVRSGITWSQQQTLVGADSVSGNFFGTAVSLQPDHALIGPLLHDHPGVEPLAGTAYVFTRSGTTWTQRQEIRSSDGQNNDFFGRAVALSTDIMVVGAPNDDGPQLANGSAYVFQIQRATGDPCSTGSQCPSGFCTDGHCCDASSPTCGSSCPVTTSPFVQLSAGMEHTCGVRADSTVTCWGYPPYFWGSTPPSGQTFTAIEAGSEHTIAIRLDGTLAFWGNDQEGLGTVPTGTFKTISAGYLHDCAIRSDATVACWGWNASGQSTPPSGAFRSVSTGTTHSCGLRLDGTLACWGTNDWGESTPPSGQFQSVSTRGQQACALRHDGTVTCWGRSTDLADWAPPPAGTFHSVQSRAVSGCAMTPARSITCWGNGSPESMAPSGQFVDYAVGNFHSCALRPDRSIVCWGRNVSGQSTPP